LLRHWAQPRTVAGLHRRCAADVERWTPPELLVLPDGSDGRIRRMRYSGPGAVLIRRSFRRRAPVTRARAALRLQNPALALCEDRDRRSADAGQVIAVPARTALDLCPVSVPRRHT
jgi:hypothetical protein